MSGFIIHGLRTNTGLNSREHWRAANDRKKKERIAVRAHMNHERIAPLEPDEWAIVRLIRVGPARIDDDNAIGALKTIRDAVADCLGVDDGDEGRITFQYGRLIGEFAVKVEIQKHATECTSSWNCNPNALVHRHPTARKP